MLKEGGVVLRISSDRDVRMGEKPKKQNPKKSLGLQTKPQKNPCTKSFSFEYPKNPYLNLQATQKTTAKIFPPRKIPKSNISYLRKSFDNPCLLKSVVCL